MRGNQINLLNWQLSVFWAFAGVVSVATCVSSTNRRLKAETARVQLQQQKVEQLERIVRLQKQASNQEQKLEQLTDLLENSGRSWWGGRHLPYRDLLCVLADNKGMSG